MSEIERFIDKVNCVDLNTVEPSINSGVWLKMIAAEESCEVAQSGQTNE